MMFSVTILSAFLATDRVVLGMPISEAPANVGYVTEEPDTSTTHILLKRDAVLSPRDLRLAEHHGVDINEMFRHSILKRSNGENYTIWLHSSFDEANIVPENTTSVNMTSDDVPPANDTSVNETSVNETSVDETSDDYDDYDDYNDDDDDDDDIEDEEKKWAENPNATVYGARPNDKKFRTVAAFTNTPDFPALNSCGHSTFADDTSHKSAKASSADAIAEWAKNNKGYFKLKAPCCRSPGRTTLIVAGADTGANLRFSVGKNPRDLLKDVYISHDDIADLVRDSRRMFQREIDGVMRFGAYGMMKCNKPVHWWKHPRVDWVIEGTAQWVHRMVYNPGES